MAKSVTAAAKFFSSTYFHLQPLNYSLQLTRFSNLSRPFSSSTSTTTTVSNKKRERRKIKSSTLPPSSSSPQQITGVKSKLKSKSRTSLEFVKRRTRSDKEFNEEYMKSYGDEDSHIPVMLGEVLDVFCSSTFSMRSFVDCTLGAAGHSAAIIKHHPELQVYIGLDMDPVAHEKARAKIDNLLGSDSCHQTSRLRAHMILKNFKEIKQVIGGVDDNLLSSGVDGILMDLGMSSMQVNDAARGFSMLNNGPLDMRMDPRASLRAEDILNSWPATEVGRILRDYGEESTWQYLQNKIVKARLEGGLHSTADLADLIRKSSKIKGGRHGWIKTAARVFQALRIAVNDELRALEDSLHACFDCLGPGGRLAVISFHSLEDRIVKQTFLNIINRSHGQGEEVGLTSEHDANRANPCKPSDESFVREPWIRQVTKGGNGVILTKRPITATTEEERVNTRCRSAKLRVIQKI